MKKKISRQAVLSQMKVVGAATGGGMMLPDNDANPKTDDKLDPHNFKSTKDDCAGSPVESDVQDSK